MMTVYGVEANGDMVSAKISELINQFYKILPMKEDGSDTIQVYIDGLLREMLGLKELMEAWENDGRYLSLLAILQYHADHPDCPVSTVKSDVFKAIYIIKQLQRKYGTHRR